MQGSADDSPVMFRTLGGSGPDCLLLHGFGSDRLSWLGNIPTLLPLVTLHVADLPGHGESSKAVGDGSVARLTDLIEIAIDRQALGRLHIVAHSLGGGIALGLAARRPERIASLTLIAPAGVGAGIDAEFLLALPEQTELEPTLRLLQRLVVKPQLIGRHVATRLLEQLAVPEARLALRRVAAGIPEAEPALAAQAAIVAQMSIPRLTIWGGADAINPLLRPRLDALAGERHILPDCAHLPHIENARAVNRVLADFLRPIVTG